ncbi:UNVERIFIED_CONTAM: hypothetical protein FKN15_020341 [Acipenser sinensis]
MFSDDRSNTISKQALNFPVGLLINSPKRRLGKLGRKPSNGSVQSSSSDTTTRSNESTGVRQPAKNKIRRHNNRLSTVFSRGPHLKDNQSDEDSTVADRMHLTDDPSELSMQLSAPGVLKIFGSEISTGANYKSVLATSHSSAQELVKEALERYSLDKAEAGAYVLCDVIGRLGEEHQWKTECFRVVGDNEKPLMLQSLWKPKEGFCRRFEIQRKSSVEKKTAKEKDTVTADDRSNTISKQALNFPVGLLINSPKRRLGKLGRKPSNGSVQSSSSDTTTRSNESTGVRQPAKNKIRRHNNRLSTVFSRGPHLKDNQSDEDSTVADRMHLTDDPSELSMQLSAPGVLKIFGSEISTGANYKSVLATSHSSAQELVKEALERYSLDKAEAGAYVLCDVIGRLGEEHQWKTECFRVVGDNEKPLMLQSLWKPKEGFCRRFEIQRKSSVEKKTAKEKDTVTAGINAQARKLQKIRSRGASVFIEEDLNSNFSLWRSLSEVNLSVKSKDPRMNGKSLLLEDLEPEVDKEGQCLGLEKEETESSDDNTTQYSIHPPFEFPYFLLLQGYSYRQDFVIYLMSEMTHVFGRCSEHSTGEDEERLKVDILLSAPDILPRHCSVRRLESSSHCEATKKTMTLVKPHHGAFVSHNGIPVKEETQLQTGDLLGLGDFYLFMYKDPTAPTAGQRPAWLTTPMTHLGGTATCKMCGSSLLGEAARKMKPSHRKSVHRLKDSNGTDLSLTYDSIHEDQLLGKVINMTDPKGDEPKLSPAFLLCLCIQHSAGYFELSDFRRLLLKIASQVQTVMWEKTKELARIQPETVKQDPDELSLLSIKELISGLQPLAFWMSNSIELLHFIQQEVPKLLLWGEEGGEIADSQVSATRSASEEAMTVLEEVIMFTFQQSVFYLTKVRPSSESFYLRMLACYSQVSATRSASEEAMTVLEEVIMFTFQQSVFYLTKVRPSSESFYLRMLACCTYYYNGVSNKHERRQLLGRGSVLIRERLCFLTGSGGGFYQWSRGVQIRANLDLLLDWIQGIGLGDLALDFFHKLSTAVNLLATPKQNLLQASWLSLRREFASLNPAQLHHMLREYNPGRPCPAGWSPTPEEAEPAMRMADILESFDNHPPLILPCSSFHIELGRPVQDLRLPSQLSRIREFLCSLKQSSPVPSQQEVPLAAESVTSACCTSSMKNTGPLQDSDTPKDRESDVKDSSLCSRFLLPCPSDLSSCGDVLTQKLKNLELQNSLPGQNDLTSHKRLALDPSCLLTPPNTPQTLELAEADTDLLERPFRHFLNGSHKGGDDKDLATPKVKGVLSPSPELGTQNKPGEEDEVFTVELERGPHGLGLALVDGLKTPLKMSGIYIKSLVPHSPAARSKKLGLGDRILAINGTSLAGVDYNTGRDLIRSSGDKLRLLVAKSEAQVLTTKIPIDLGFEISVPKEKFAMVNLSNHRKMTRDMMEVLFSKEEMATSSVTGRKSNTKENAVMKSSLCKCAATVSNCGENCHKDHNGIEAKRCGHSLQR